MKENLELSSQTSIQSTVLLPIDSSSDNDTVQSLSSKSEIGIEHVKLDRQRTIEKIMAESDISFGNSDDEISTEQFENELADMKAKSKDIEEMIEKLVSFEQ
jgi:hypothetical protein